MFNKQISAVQKRLETPIEFSLRIPKVSFHKAPLMSAEQFKFSTDLMRENFNRIANQLDDTSDVSQLSYKVGLSCYRENSTVRSCIDILSDYSSAVPWDIRKKSSDDLLLPMPPDALQDLLNQPNKQTVKKNFYKQIVMDLYMCGSAFSSKIRSTIRGGQVIELRRLPPDQMRIIRDENGDVVSYLQVWGHRDDQKKSWKYEDVIQFSFVGECSPLEAGLKAIISDQAIVQWWTDSLQNGMKPDALISFKHDLTAEQIRKLRLIMIEQMAARSGNARSPLFMGHEAVYTQLNSNPAELDWTTSRKFTKDEICSLHRVPPALLDPSQLQAKALEEILQFFWQNTIFLTVLDLIKDTLTLQLLPEFYKDGQIKKRVLIYDTHTIDALMPYYGEKVKILIDMTTVGIPLNVAIRSLGLNLPQIMGGDTGMLPSNLMNIGSLHSRIRQDVLSPDTPSVGGQHELLPPSVKPAKESPPPPEK